MQQIPRDNHPTMLQELITTNRNQDQTGAYEAFSPPISAVDSSKLQPISLRQTTFKTAQPNMSGAMTPEPSPSKSPEVFFSSILYSNSGDNVRTESPSPVSESAQMQSAPSLSITETSSALNSESRDIFQVMQDLKLFLATAPTSLSGPGGSVCKFPMPDGDSISCVLWNNIYHITGTDIVKCMIFRFKALGRTVVLNKKFEEGVFSDLRNLKPGFDAALEGPRSPFLEFLFNNKCIRTQKKQKVFYWFSVPHNTLFLDAVTRDIKREQQGLQPTSVSDYPCSHAETMIKAESQCSPLIQAEHLVNVGGDGPQLLAKSDTELGNGAKMSVAHGEPSAPLSLSTHCSPSASPVKPGHRQIKRGGSSVSPSKILLSKAFGNAAVNELSPRMKEIYRTQSLSSDIFSEKSSSGSSARSSVSSLGSDDVEGAAKFFNCAHPGCNKRFKLFENLRRHLRVHDDSASGLSQEIHPTVSESPHIVQKQDQNYLQQQYQQQAHHLSKLFDQGLRVVSPDDRPIGIFSPESHTNCQPVFTTGSQYRIVDHHFSTNYPPIFPASSKVGDDLPWTAAYNPSLHSIDPLDPSYRHQIKFHHSRTESVNSNISVVSTPSSLTIETGLPSPSRPPMFDVNNNLLETPSSYNSAASADSSSDALFSSLMRLPSPLNGINPFSMEFMSNNKDPKSELSAERAQTMSCSFVGDYRPLFSVSMSPTTLLSMTPYNQIQQQQQQHHQSVFMGKSVGGLDSKQLSESAAENTKSDLEMQNVFDKINTDTEDSPRRVMMMDASLSEGTDLFSTLPGP